jgi:hypothetical protein
MAWEEGSCRKGLEKVVVAVVVVKSSLSKECSGVGGGSGCCCIAMGNKSFFLVLDRFLGFFLCSGFGVCVGG